MFSNNPVIRFTLLSGTFDSGRVHTLNLLRKFSDMAQNNTQANAQATAAVLTAAQVAENVVSLLVKVAEGKNEAEKLNAELNGFAEKVPSFPALLAIANDAVVRAYDVQEKSAYFDEAGVKRYRDRQVKYCTMRICTLMKHWYKEKEARDVTVKAKHAGGKVYTFEVSDKVKAEAPQEAADLTEEEQAMRAAFKEADTLSKKVLALFEVARGFGIPADIVSAWSADIDQWQAAEAKAEAAKAIAAAEAAAAEAKRLAENAAAEADAAAKKATQTRARKTRDAAKKSEAADAAIAG